MSIVPTPIDLFVVGAMKAATTGMCDWLSVQEGLAMSQPKEPSVFVSDDAAASWIPRLDTLFPRVAVDSLRVEGSTDYAKYPAIGGVPERIARHCPEARFVYMMRDPVARAISQYRFEWLLGGDRMSFEQSLHVNKQLVDNGRYGMQLNEWLKWFPADRFLLVFSEAFAHDAPTQVSRVLRFMGLEPRNLRSPAAERSNETSMLVRPSVARTIFRESRFGEFVRPLVPRSVVRRYKDRQQERSRPELSEEVLRRLHTTFDEDLLELDRLIGGHGLTSATWRTVATTLTPALHAA